MRIRIAVLTLLLAINLNSVADEASRNWDYMAITATKWHAYNHKAFEVAKESGRPVFVLVYSDSCSWCERYEKEVLETEVIHQKLRKDFIPVAVNIKRQRALAIQLKASVVPTTLILAPDGAKLIRFHGLAPANEIADTLEQTLTAWRQGKLPVAEDFGSEEFCCPIENR